MPAEPESRRRFRPDLLAAALAGLAIIAFHLIFYAHAGGLYRDEANSVRLATLPALGDYWAMVEFDSFPALFPLLLRLWWLMGLADTDPQVRLLGLLLGLALLAALAGALRGLKAAAPVASLGLFAASPVVVAWGDTVRAYALGAALLLGVLVSVWRLVQSPSTGRAAAALLVTLACIHCVYYNATFVLAIFLAGMTVCARRRQWRRILLLNGVGFLAALSLLIYLPGIARSRDWFPLQQPVVNWQTYVQGWSDSLAVQHPALRWVWPAAALLAVALAVAQQRRAAPTADEAARDRSLFAVVTLLLSGPLFLLFLARLRYIAEPWYYLIWLGLAAVCLDIIFTPWTRGVCGRWIASILMAVLVLLSVPALWRETRTRITNIDYAAVYLERHAQPGDHIVLIPWFNGISFARYYDGAAAWSTVPPLTDRQTFRPDLVKQAMLSPDPLRPLVQELENVLRGGGRVWLVRTLRPLPPGRKSLTLPVAPQGAQGWLWGPYHAAWASQIDYLLQTRAEELVNLGAPMSGPVQEYEKVRVQIARGWRVEAEPVDQP